MTVMLDLQELPAPSVEQEPHSTPFVQQG